jgi:hypothetical protein
MVNPDGAERFTRRTALNIDMNRDALRLATPEARALKSLRDEIRPSFGFNLHDQDPRYTVGTTGRLTAIALLAPPFDASGADNAVRSRARRLAAVLAQALATQIPGHVAKWDDTFEPRAFGDNVQRWGTSTVLIESGGWKNDPEKMYLRKLNAAALLTSFLVIGEGTFENASPDAYDELQQNMRFGYDLILRNCPVRSTSSNEIYRVDVALNREERPDRAGGNRTDRWVVEDVGDLHTFTAYSSLDLTGTEVDPSLTIIDAEFSPEKLKSLIPRFEP